MQLVGVLASTCFSVRGLQHVTELRRTHVADLVADLCDKTGWLVTHPSSHPRYIPQMNKLLVQLHAPNACADPQ